MKGSVGCNQAWLATLERITPSLKGFCRGEGKASHPGSAQTQSWSQTALFFPRKAFERATYFVDVTILGGPEQRREQEVNPFLH